MKISSFVLVSMLSLIGLSAAHAETPAATATSVSALCNDGTSFTGTTKQGACSGHKGVKAWNASSPSAPVAATPAAKPATVSTEKPTKSEMPTVAAAGGGAGKVWVNPKSKTYHCFGTEHYGKTKEGSYMTEAAAKAAGDHAVGGKACN
ncbi:hypothetical protein [Methylotenera sp.]|uniref:hypothetical protein n=1 Tax=Methylotenera sp. TaxID=2051956 RepID=UPI00248A730A|nr:hypothetical protein [Methylotenera sp.]MDI1297850.1 hypothetical protein [Methylotenera sp.]